MKIYTKKGDLGTTSLLGKTQVYKSETRINAYGHVDELNVYIGLLLADAKERKECLDEKLEILDFLQNIQFQLLTIGSHLACVDKTFLKQIPPLKTTWTDNLEKQIDQMTEHLPPLRNFILPGGSRIASLAHLCRVTCRKTERTCVDLRESIDPMILAYLNRLSDYFFTLSRYLNYLQKIPDTIWNPDQKP